MIIFDINSDHIVITRNQADEIMSFIDGKKTNSIFKGIVQDGFIKREWKDFIDNDFEFYSIIESGYTSFSPEITTMQAQYKKGSHGPIYKIFSKIETCSFSYPVFPTTCKYDVVVVHEDKNKLAKLKMMLE